MENIIPVILSGGEGSRLWPLSTPQKPKQFHTLCSRQTLLEATLGRLRGITQNPPIVICNQKHKSFVHELAPTATMIVEPLAKNTAAAFAAIGTFIQSQPMGHHNPWLLILPSDHSIGNVSAFHKAIETIVNSGLDDALHTFGVVPRFAHTGYGYIQAHGESEPFAVETFIEKPEKATAENLIKQGHHFWNSGMFMMRLSALHDAFNQYAPHIWKDVEKSLEKTERNQAYFLNEELFSQVENISFDYAVMERAQNTFLTPLDAGWNDIGSWRAVWDSCEKDSLGNICEGSTTLVDSTDNLIFSQTNRHIAVSGVHDKVIVDTQGALLVLDKHQDQQVKTLLAQMAHDGICANVAEGRVYRPWGWFEVLQSESNHVVKRIMVSPQGVLSLQRHKHRSEHWVVVGGLATVTKASDTFDLKVGESIFIEQGEVHRLENKTAEPIYIIETQVGEILSEDDIERLEDVYGRS